MSILTFRKPAWQRLSSPDLTHGHYEELYRAVLSGQWEPGRRVQTMERGIARLLKVRPEQVVATASATAALDAALIALGGRQWRVCPLTYKATWVAALNHGDEVAFIDCDRDGWPVAPVDIGVELWGRRWPAERLGLPLVLDCAHRAPTRDQAEHLERGTQMLVYSFNVQKEISCLHGGALVLADAALAPAIRKYLRCGTENRVGDPTSLGIKGYLQDPLAAVIAAKVRRLDRVREYRQKILRVYQEYLGAWLVTPPDSSGALAVLRFATKHERERVRLYLHRHHVETSIHYQVTREFSTCPGAQELSQRILTIPCHTGLREVDAQRVARMIVAA